MRIVFWSEEPACGTTSNMIAVASLLASKYGYRIALIPAEKNTRDFSFCFSGRERMTVKEDCAYYALEGLDYLLMAGKYGALTERHLEEALQTIVEERLFCLPQGTRLLCDYYPKETKRVLNQTIQLLDRKMDLSFIDCGNRQDDWTKNQMKRANLIVVNFSQTAQGLDHFFSSQALVSEKIIYFIGNYQKDSVYNKKNIHRIYRIAPEKLGVIPYNPEFDMVCREGKLDKYVKGKKFLVSTNARDYFLSELEQAAQIIIRKIGGEEEKKNDHADKMEKAEGSRV